MLNTKVQILEFGFWAFPFGVEFISETIRDRGIFRQNHPKLSVQSIQRNKLH
jgi:hypothetical protein